MKKLICKQCNKTIEGYSSKHVKYLMAQHNLSKHHKSNAPFIQGKNRENQKTKGEPTQ